MTGGSQNRAIDEPEDREVGADRDGQREDGAERRDGRRQERANGGGQIRAEAFKHWSTG